MKYYFIVPILLISLNLFSQSIPNEIQSLSKHPIKNTTINNLNYYYIEKGEGPTIFLLHGFPDLANTWDEAIDKLSKEYHCVAPFLRGYYPTGIPTDNNYDTRLIADDVNKIAVEMGIEKYYVIGQDWGAAVAHSMFNLYPDKIIKGVTIAIPHPTCIKANPILLIRARHFLKFANEKKAVSYTKKNNFQYLDKLYKRWSPGWTTYTTTSNLIKATFAMEGRTEAALGYYWSFNKLRSDKSFSEHNSQIPQMPILTLVGKKDGALVLSQFKKMKEIMNSDFELKIHEDAGHFLHREEVDFFVKSVLGFF